MATLNVTLKRWNGTSTDTMHPQTNMEKIQVSTTNTQLLADYLSSTYLPQSQKGQANGLASLGSDGLVPFTQLPVGLGGAFKVKGGVATSNGMQVIIADLDAYLTSKAVDKTNLTAVENMLCGLVYTASIDLTFSEGTIGTFDWYHSYEILSPGDEGDYTMPISLEAGDAVIVAKITEMTTDKYKVSFMIQNNTYQVASTGAHGIVRLSDITNMVDAVGNDVITEGILLGLIGNSSGKIAAGDHNHYTVHYMKSEVQNFFSGATAITGYNKTNWDTAYTHSQAAHAPSNAQKNSDILQTEIEAKLTGTVTTHNHNSQYYTETELNSWVRNELTINGISHTPIVYGATPTSDVIGAILIDVD